MSFWRSLFPGRNKQADLIVRIDRMREEEERLGHQCGDRLDWDGTTYHEARAGAFAEVLVMLRGSAT